MEEKNVALLATLLKKPKEEIIKALESDDGLQPLVSDFATNNKVYSLDDAIKLEKNIKTKTIENLTEEDIPESFRAKAVGWKLERLEGEIKEKYQFTDEFKGLPDLVDKIITKTKIPSDNEDEVKALKQRIVDLSEEYEGKLNSKQSEFDRTLIQAEFDEALEALGLDYEGDVLAKQKELVKAAFNDVYGLKRKDQKTIVLKGDKVVEDKKYDPLPLGDVLGNTVKEYGFQLKTPEAGGHGGTSSKNKLGLKGVSFTEYLVEKKVTPNTEQADKLYVEWKATNK